MDYSRDIDKLRHTCSHVLAQAVKQLWPDVKVAIGPAIETGFYYDIDLGDHQIGEEDLRRLEVKMAELAKQSNAFVRKEISKADAIQYFGDKGDQYKLDLLSGLQDGGITLYTQGNFTDLCRGPHIPNTGFIKGIKLTNIAGAYWKGDEKNKMLTRIYGVTFPSSKELEEYLVLLEEAKQRLFTGSLFEHKLGRTTSGWVQQEFGHLVVDTRIVCGMVRVVGNPVAIF